MRNEFRGNLVPGALKNKKLRNQILHENLSRNYYDFLIFVK